MRNARVFIASSVEGLDVAYAVQELLEHSADCTVWDQGVFEPSSYTLNDLAITSAESDYGIFVFSPDDVTKLRDSVYATTRDNVILELGLFIGSLGKERCFIIMPHDVNNFHIPTDLAGLKPLTYKADREDRNLRAALGPCANQIRNSMQKYRLHTEKIDNQLLEQIKNVGLSAFYSSRDDYAKYRTDAASIDRYINTAQRTLKIVSISLITGIQFDDVITVLRNRLCNQNDFQVTISLLNPFNKELYLALAPLFDTDHNALLKETKKSLRKLFLLKSELPTDAQERFDIKVHNAIPCGSAILIDEGDVGGKIQIETKPYKVVWRKSFSYEIENDSHSAIFFETICSSYNKLIDDGLHYKPSLESLAEGAI